jgi:hypothetical protein
MFETDGLKGDENATSVVFGRHSPLLSQIMDVIKFNLCYYPHGIMVVKQRKRRERVTGIYGVSCWVDGGQVIAESSKSRHLFHEKFGCPRRYEWK